MDQYLPLLWLVPLGFFAGGFGTIIGAGGGFILAPALLFLFPGEAPEAATSVSLAVVFFNSLSGTLAYARSKRIDYKSGSIFAGATIPGAILGALTTTGISRAYFNLAFGGLLMLVGIFLAVSPAKKTAYKIAQAGGGAHVTPHLTRPMLLLGSILSLAFGFLSSFFGIGGGVLYVPTLTYALKFPIHIATATSLFVLTITAFSGAATHTAAGLYHGGIQQIIGLSVGAILGAQVGARLSHRLHGDWIIRGLATALALAGIRLVASAL